MKQKTEGLRQLGRDYDGGILSDNEISPANKYYAQLRKDFMKRTAEELMDLRELEFTTNNELFIRHETGEKGHRRGFVILQDAFNKMSKSDKNKLFGELL